MNHFSDWSGYLFAVVLMWSCYQASKPPKQEF